MVERSFHGGQMAAFSMETKRMKFLMKKRETNGNGGVQREELVSNSVI